MWFGKNISDYVEVVSHTKKTKQTFEDLQINERGSMLTYDMQNDLLQAIPGLNKYSLIFNASSKVVFRGNNIIVHHPLKGGLMTPYTQTFDFSAITFLELIDAGWLRNELTKFSYYDILKKPRDVTRAKDVYSQSIEDLGYGSYLYMLLDEKYGFEKIASPPCLDTFRREGMRPILTTPPDDDVLRIGISDNCPFYYTDEPVIEEEKQYTTGDHEVRIIPYERDLPSDQSFAICVDGLEREGDIYVEQFMALVSVDGERDSSFSVDITLYDRTIEADTISERKYYTKKRTLFSGKSKTLLTEVFEASHIRSKLTGSTLKHKKFKKYNPRRYLYLNFYVYGKIKFKINMFLRTLTETEPGVYYIYKGPKLKYNESLKSYESTPLVVPSPMTDRRRGLVNIRTGINFSQATQHNFRHFLTLRSCLAPLDKLLTPDLCVCPIHQIKCGVRIRSPHLTQLDVTVCFVENPDLYEFMINFINRTFKIPIELISKRYDKQLVYKEPLTDKFKGPFFIRK